MNVKGTLSGDLGDDGVADPATHKGVKGTLSGDDGVAGDRWSGAGEGGPGERTDRDAPPVEDGLAAADYEVQRELGRGGMGIVWIATQRSLSRPVAVKTLRAELCGGAPAGKFEAEALITGRLEHPNIPPVHAYGRDDLGRPYLCMKLVKGVEWAKLLEPRTPEEKERAGKLDFRAHLKIIERACEAIGFAHAHGILHRDLKPENVMVGEFGEVLVMDWGIALDLKERDARLAREAARGPGGAAAPRRPVGTPAYVPPEMAQADEAGHGPWTDVYLLGGMLYELLAGVPPHKGESVMEVLLAAQKGEVEPPRARAPGREIPEALADVAMKALHPDPERRYRSASEFEDGIREYLRNEASVKLSDAALAELARVEAAIAAGRAPTGEIYPAFAACIAELRQAEKLWSGNRAAREGLVAARLAYASFALDRGDVALAESQLEAVPPDAPGLPALRELVAAVHAARAADARRRKRMFALLGLAVVLAIGAGALAVRQGRRADESEARRVRRAEAVGIAEGATWLATDERIEVLERALRVDPKWPEGWSDLARAQMDRSYDLWLAGEMTAAARYLDGAVGGFDAAVELEPGNEIIVADRGYVHEVRGDLPRALADLRRAIELGPESHAGGEGRVMVAFAEGRFADAEREGTRTIAIAPNETDFFRRALARYCLGDMKGALEDAKKCEKLATRGEDEYYHALHALILLGDGRVREGADRIVRGLRYAPRGPHLLPLLAYLAARHGDVERARALEALAREAQRRSARCWLAMDPCWRAAARAKPPYDVVGKALAMELDFASIFPAVPARTLALRRRGEERFARGEHELALADADRALGDDPADGYARLLRARCFLALGHLDAARADLAASEVLAPHRLADIEAVKRALEGK